ncbi:MAG TPA: gluconate 2-dehydrogenase subunit 3 family protein, partial [Hymenobacter sp.]
MNRRTAVKNLAFITGAALVLPSCFQEAAKEQKASIPLKHVEITASQEKLLAEVCETIIPKTDTPGAKDLAVPAYVLRMLDDCCEEKEQKAFVAGMKDLEKDAKKQHNQSFAACTPQQKLAMLQAIEQQKDATTDLASFYKTARRLTVSGYTKSKYFLTKEVVY